jgi:Xaa-Pro dipeptidase
MVKEDIFSGLKSDDGILIRNGGEGSTDKAFTYLSGAVGGLFENSSIIASKDRIKLYVFSLEEQTARATGLDVEVAGSVKQMNENLQKDLKGVRKIGLNFDSLTVNLLKETEKLLPGVEFFDASKNIMEARMVKSKEEIARLQEAAKISSEIYHGILSSLKEGMKETEVAALMNYRMMQAGASGVGFDTIVCFGENSAEPHHSPGDRKLKKGDYVLTDYGAKYKDYTADTTRTAVFGKATSEQKEIYSIVYRAQSESMNMIKPGINGKLVNQKSYDVIDATKYKGRLMHGVGHGIGLDVHDHSAFGSSDFTIKENMAVTVEPGIYIPGFGGVRIEDDVLVTKQGYRLLTAAPPKDLIEVI